MKMSTLLKRLADSKTLPAVNTAEDYKQLAESDRTKRVWFWPSPWYILPGSLLFDMNESLSESIGRKKHEGNDEWARCFAFLKKQYPIQYFIRVGIRDLKISHKLLHIKWKLEDFQYGVSCFFNPRQKWLTKIIGNRWCDKPELLLNVMYAFIVDYVEEEKALSVIDWTVSKEAKRTKNSIQEIYDWIKVGRSNLEKEIERSYDEHRELRTEANKRGLQGKEFIKFVYEKTETLEKKLSDMDTLYLKKIVDVKDSLWT